MKSFTPYLLLTVLLCFFQTAQASEPQFLPQFQPDERVHDFGTIREKNGKVSHVFTFTNRSKVAVAITMVDASCGCTTADYSRQLIRPGQKARVKVTFNPAFRPGRFSKEVRVILNNGRYYVRCWVKGNVEGYLHPVTEDYPYAFGRGLYMSLQLLPFSQLHVGETATLRLGLANDTKRSMTITFQRVPNNRVLKMPERIVLKPLERRYVTVSYRFYKVYTYDRTIRLRVFVDGHEVSPLRVVWYGDHHFLHMK